MTPTVLAERPTTAVLCPRCHHDTTDPADLGFGYSREPDTTAAPVAAPAGVELVFLPGRAIRPGGGAA